MANTKAVSMNVFGHRCTCLESVNPDYAARKFGEDAKRRARRRILALQVPDNKTDSVKLRVPCGFKCPRVYHGLNFTFG